MNPKWQRLRGDPEEPALFELFHENSKVGGFSPTPPDEVILATMARLWEALPYPQYPAVALPSEVSVSAMPLAEAISSRRSVAALASEPIPFATLASLLRLSYGVTLREPEGSAQRSRRAVPSGGALFPLEVYFHATRVDGLKPGLYHFDPIRDEVQRLKDGNHSGSIADALVQGELASSAAVMVFITAVFERSLFKYGERGYRFLLMEAGHVGQNLALLATAHGLGCLPIGGYFDRRIDEFLELDGVTHSTVYLAAIGVKAATEDP